MSEQPLPQRSLIIEHTEALAVSLDRMAELVGVSRSTLTDLIDHQGFPAVRIGRRRIVPVVAAQRWLEQHIGTHVETVAGKTAA